MANLYGGSVNVTPSTGIAVGKPYPLGSGLVGICDRPLVANVPGAIDLTFGRVVPIAKPTGAGTNYAQFATVSLYPVTPDGLAVTGATGVKLGIVAVQPATTDTTVQVLLIPGASL
jgi:hypothetical protein